VGLDQEMGVAMEDQEVRAGRVEQEPLPHSQTWVLIKLMVIKFLKVVFTILVGSAIISRIKIKLK
jgi:hypothetical protein